MKLTKEETYILRLSEEEAEWLTGIMQNPLHGETPTDENIEDRKMRAKFYETLTDYN